MASELPLERLRNPASALTHRVHVTVDHTLADATLVPLSFEPSADAASEAAAHHDVVIGTIDGLPALRSIAGGTYVMERRPAIEASVVRVAPAPERSMWFEHRLVNEVLLSMATDRGLTLHGALLGRDGVAVVFVGPSFAGKSTLALTAARTPGMELLSEDGCLLTPNDTGWIGFPGPLGVGVRDATRHKTLVTAGDPSVCEPRPIAGVVVLADRQRGRDPVCQRFDPVEALPELTNQTFRATKSDLAGQFAFAAGLLRNVPAFRVSMPDDITLVQPAMRAVFHEVLGA